MAPVRHAPYSPDCLEEAFSEVCLITFNTNITHLSDALLYLTGVSYRRIMGEVAEGAQPMYRRMVVRQSLRLGVVLTLIALALSACGGGEEQAKKPRPLPEDPKALRPGTYRSEEFKPSLSFRVGKGWSSAPLESSDALQIARGQTAGLGFANVQEVYKPTRTGTPTWSWGTGHSTTSRYVHR